MPEAEDHMNFNTRLLHGKGVKNYADGATLPPIAQVSAFRYQTAEELDKVFHHKAMGYAYSRVSNPSVAAFEQRINELEKGNAAVACSSGMAAIALALLNILSCGDEIIASSGLYGGSIDLLEDLSKFGIRTKYARHLTPEEAEPLISPKTRLIFGEVLSNPSLEVLDVRKIADFAHGHGLPLFVDATTVTPYLFNPVEFGADVVIHSTTKYINGSGDAVGGIIVDGGHFPWDFDLLYEMASEPEKTTPLGKINEDLRFCGQPEIAENAAPQTGDANILPAAVCILSGILTVAVCPDRKKRIWL